MLTIQDEYKHRHRIMQNDLHNLRAQRRKASTDAERKRCEAMIDAKRAELLALRREALVQAELWL